MVFSKRCCEDGTWLKAGVAVVALWAIICHTSITGHFVCKALFKRTSKPFPLPLYCSKLCTGWINVWRKSQMNHLSLLLYKCTLECLLIHMPFKRKKMRSFCHLCAQRETNRVEQWRHSGCQEAGFAGYPQTIWLAIQTMKKAYVMTLI